MPPKPVLYTTGLIVALSLLASSLLRGSAPESPAEWLSPVGPGVAIAGLALLFFDAWLWRQPIIKDFHGRPVLHGTWHGELASDWIDDDGERVEPNPDVFLVIHQRFWRISARLLTAESRSNPLFAELQRGPDGVCELIYVYRNTPRADVRHRSEVHYGAVVLSAPRDPSHGLEGHYFTDRKTRGSLRLHTRYKDLAGTYAAARRLAGEEPPSPDSEALSAPGR